MTPAQGLKLFVVMHIKSRFDRGFFIRQLATSEK